MKLNKFVIWVNSVIVIGNVSLTKFIMGAGGAGGS